MGFSKQEYLSRLSLPIPRDLSDPWMETVSPELASRFFTAELQEALVNEQMDTFKTAHSTNALCKCEYHSEH